MAENSNGDTTNSGPTRKETYTQKYDPEEISPLKSREQKSNSNISNQDFNVNVVNNDVTDPNSPVNKKDANKLRGTYKAVMTQMELTERVRLPFFILLGLCLLLLMVIIILVACWPRVASYMKADVCVENECLEASSQLLRWSKTTENPCNDPYEWSCGKFRSDYLQHDFYGMQRIEWNFQTNAEYDDILTIQSFISKLPSETDTYSVQFKIWSLYNYCMNLETNDNNEGISELKRAIHNLRGWVHMDTWSKTWDFREALQRLQSQYGPAPFFKVSIESSIKAPYGSIIAIDEGEFGLPHKMFYNLNERHKIIKAYKILLRDVAISFGVVTGKALLFADHIYNYEKRIVNNLANTEVFGETEINVIKTLGELKQLAPSIPILDTIRIMFPNSTENTLVLVKNVEVLRAISNIVSTSDIQVLNNFVIWSLIRHFLPFISREFRVTLEQFENALYDIETPPPQWYKCTKLVNDWFPFGVDVLRENSQLVLTNPNRDKIDSLGSYQSEQLRDEKFPKNNDDLVRMIFFHIRNEFRNSINDAEWINEKLSNFINNKLSSIKIQIGIPDELVKTTKFIDKYYDDFITHKMYFLKNIESKWNFVKNKMNQKLSNIMEKNEKLISELYPVEGIDKYRGQHYVKYSLELNTVIISRKALSKPYFHQNYPIGVNFAHLGNDIAKALLKVAIIASEQFREAALRSINVTVPYGNSIFGESYDCLIKLIRNGTIPEEAKLHLHSEVQSGKLAMTAFQSFLINIKNNKQIEDSELSNEVSYELFGLTNHGRQPGLRQYNEDGLFTLAFLQRQCSVISPSYANIKPFVDNEIPNKELFKILWLQIPDLAAAFSCSSSNKLCYDLL